MGVRRCGSRAPLAAPAARVEKSAPEMLKSRLNTWLMRTPAVCFQGGSSAQPALKSPPALPPAEQPAVQAHPSAGRSRVVAEKTRREKEHRFGWKSSSERSAVACKKWCYIWL